MGWRAARESRWMLTLLDFLLFDSCYSLCQVFPGIIVKLLEQLDNHVYLVIPIRHQSYY